MPQLTIHKPPEKKEYSGPIQIGACEHNATIFTVTIRGYKTCDCSKFCDSGKSSSCPYKNATIH